jgi:hypothetical protein
MNLVGHADDLDDPSVRERDRVKKAKHSAVKVEDRCQTSVPLSHILRCFTDAAVNVASTDEEAL